MVNLLGFKVGRSGHKSQGVRSLSPDLDGIVEDHDSLDEEAEVALGHGRVRRDEDVADGLLELRDRGICEQVLWGCVQRLDIVKGDGQFFAFSPKFSQPRRYNVEILGPRLERRFPSRDASVDLFDL